jgi:hypothetical protein
MNIDKRENSNCGSSSRLEGSTPLLAHLISFKLARTLPSRRVPVSRRQSALGNRSRGQRISPSFPDVQFFAC